MDKDNFSFRIFREKHPDANPYYPSAEGLYCCTRAVRELQAKAGKHEISIDRIAGGHRGAIQNDAEIDLSVRLSPEVSVSDYKKFVEEVCKELEVGLLFYGD